MGQKLEVLIDEFALETQTAIGRTKGDAPEIDGLVYIQGLETQSIGTLVEVLIHDSDVHDLYADAIIDSLPAKPPSPIIGRQA